MENNKPKKTRLLYIDFARGLAVFMMIRTHVMNAFLSDNQRHGIIYGISEFSGGYPSAAFLFLAGLSVGLTYKNLSDISFSKRLWISVKRGLEVLGAAFIFRAILAAQWLPYVEWKGLLKVDILNNIGLSLILLGIVFTVFKCNKCRITALAIISIAVPIATPYVWDISLLKSLPECIKDYIIGPFNKNWHFPLFPLFSFVTSGALIGVILSQIKNEELKMKKFHTGLIVGGILIITGGILAAKYLPHSSNWDYWFSSPEFQFIRTGIQFISLAMCYYICFLKSTLLEYVYIMGRHSLFIYVVHILIVYGRIGYLFEKKFEWIMCHIILAAITLLMIYLCYFKEKQMIQK
jgi:uncharacterized membrane protein